MPSPSQDSEKLTDAELARMKDAARPDPRDFGIQQLEKRAIRLLIAEVQRARRTPSVPGEDMRAIAKSWLESGLWLTPEEEGPSLDDYAEALAVLLSSTAALAREEERERCLNLTPAVRAILLAIADAAEQMDPQRGMTVSIAPDVAWKILSEIANTPNLRELFPKAVAAIRAIGKEG